ncbi:MAG: TusE/DsrC/DsvC family sulfur relay protein [Burkholderiales bacterium]|jgi:tRNA 2-thiouridine synthesizing protein E|nr:TusE/DsrC/DsvC family sulfur relay protein [Burkholderiales bacterium]
MNYEVNGSTIEADEEGYLLEANYSDEVCAVIAQAEGITLTDDHRAVIDYLREQYREHGQTPNFRAMLKDLAELLPHHDSKTLYDLFPGGPAKQGVRFAGLPKPFGKGGY